MDLGFLVNAWDVFFRMAISHIQTLVSDIGLFKIGEGLSLSAVGVVFLCTGVMFLFNRGLLIMGNFLVFAGPVHIFGLQRTLGFLTMESNRLASSILVGGLFVVLISRWLSVGVPLEICGLFLLIRPYLPPDPMTYLVDLVARFLGLDLEEHEKTAAARVAWSSVIIGLGFRSLGMLGAILGFTWLLLKSDFPVPYKLTAGGFFTGGMVLLFTGWSVVGMLVVVCAHVLLFRNISRPFIMFLRKIPVLGSILSHPFIERHFLPPEEGTPGSREPAERRDGEASESF